ncbi:MAG: prenyltransferase/squalene oxidase repeat-containing protein [Planctomycetota bacterium]
MEPARKGPEAPQASRKGKAARGGEDRNAGRWEIFLGISVFTVLPVVLFLNVLLLLDMHARVREGIKGGLEDSSRPRRTRRLAQSTSGTDREPLPPLASPDRVRKEGEVSRNAAPPVRSSPAVNRGQDSPTQPEPNTRFSRRPNGERRQPRYGIGTHTEAAVLWGLIWLRNHQDPDGKWSCKNFMMNCKGGTCTGPGGMADYDMGVTSLAVLAFLGAGQSHKHGKFKSTVKKGLKAMKERQTPEGCLGSEGENGRWMINHAIGTLALAEAYGLSNRSPLLQGPAQKAVDFLVDCQNPNLGWRYGRQPGESDTFVTGWAVLALKGAKISGLHVPKECFDGALNWFDRVTDESNYRVGYLNKGDSFSDRYEIEGTFKEMETMTALAVLSRIYILGTRAVNRPEILGGGTLLVQKPPLWDAEAGTIDMLYWHFGTMAMFQLGRMYWKAWNPPMKTATVTTQVGAGCEKGSWDPAGIWGAAGGRVYATAINVLTLEVYYRYGRILRVR